MLVAGGLRSGTTEHSEVRPLWWMIFTKMLKPCRRALRWY